MRAIYVYVIFPMKSLKCTAWDFKQRTSMSQSDDYHLICGIKLFKHDRVLTDIQVLKLHYHVHQCSKTVKSHRIESTVRMYKTFWTKITSSKNS